MQLRKWECVEDMGHIANHRTNLQRFHYQTDQHSMKQPELFPPARKRSFECSNCKYHSPQRQYVKLTVTLKSRVSYGNDDYGNVHISCDYAQ